MKEVILISVAVWMGVYLLLDWVGVSTRKALALSGVIALLAGIILLCAIVRMTA